MKVTFKVIFASALMFQLMVPSFSLDRKESKYASSQDSINYTRSLSFYKEFYKINLYEHAIDPWWELYNNYPASSEKLYLDGLKMYRNFIEAASDTAERQNYIDTLMLIYDQRIEYFGGEGNVLGRKGKDLLAYGRSDIEQVQEAYAMLKRSIELEGEKSRDVVILNFISAGISLKNKEKLDDVQLVDDYFTVITILEQMERRGSRWEKTRSTVDEIMLKEDILSCESLDPYFERQFEQNKNDKSFLENLISTYSKSGCEDSDIFMAASENLYLMVPGPESAHNLAIMHISRGDYLKAVNYLQMAVLGDNIEMETRAQWFYELAILSSANKDYCEAISYAREAIANKSDLGKAYMTLGDVIIASRTSMKDDFEQRAAFWAAADKYALAASVDPSLATEARQKLNEYMVQYPDKEEIFFRELKDGATYQVKGCINENTTVRARK